MPALHNGSITLFDGVSEEVLVYARKAAGLRLFIVVNFGPQTREVDISSIAAGSETLLSSRFATHEGTIVTLQPHESILLRIE